MLPQRFKKRNLNKALLSQTIIAGLALSAAGTAIAAPDSDFYLNGNAATIGTTTASINTNGVISTATVTRNTNTTTLPDITLPMADLQTASTHQIRVGLKATSGANTLEVRLGVVNITTDGADITTFSLAENPGDPGYEKIYAYVNLNGNVTITSEFDVPAGVITANSNDITLDMSTIISEISAQGAVADALAAFTSTGTINYKLAINQIAGTDGASAARLGHYDSGSTTFTPSPETANWNDATLNGDFTNASVLSGSLVILAADSGGSTPDPDEEDEVTIPESDITDLDNETDQADQQVDQELESGSVSENTVTQTEEVTNDAADQTDQLVTGSQTGEVSTGNVLDVLATSSKTAVTGSKVVNATTTADKTTVTETTKKVISNSATLLDTIASSNEGSDAALTDDQKTQVVNTIVNMATAAKNVTSGSTGKESTAKEMKQNLEKAFQATTRLKVPLTDEAETAIKEAAVSIQVAALAELTGKSSDEVTQEDLQAAFNDPETREKVLAASPKLPLKNPRSNADIEAEINSYITANYPAKSTAVAKDATKQTQDNSDDSPADNYDDDESIADPGCPLLGLMRPGACPGFFIQEPAESSNGAQYLAATEPTQTDSATFKPSGMTYDKATATTSMPVGDGIMKFSQLGQKAVPAGLTAGIVTQPDGRLTLVGSQGVAMDLAPTAEDTIAMAIALDDMGFPMAFRNDGSFELALASNDKFTGTFGFDTLPAGDRAACGDMTFAPTASIEVNQPGYVFTAECENGITQNIAPFVAEAGMYESLANGGFTLLTNRNTGVISVEGVGDFKPSFFSSTPTEAEIAYQAQNSDDLGFAYMPMDVNGDGRIDFKIITGTRVQIMYAVP